MRIHVNLEKPIVGQPLSDREAMLWAIEEAKKGATKASPNPLVGAVVVDSCGNFVSSGYHEYFGGPHAEVCALEGVKPEQLEGATLYVTLEPCAHEGKTPSCAKMIAKLPVKKVIFGLIDPNPKVSGQGVQILKEAGIACEVYQEDDYNSYEEVRTQLEAVCEVFLKNQRSQQLFIALKVASSLDGTIALDNGESKWITSEEAREHAHYLRACYDLICVGSKTILADNPSLNIRHPQITKEAKILVIDPRGAILRDYSKYKISTVHKPENVLFAVTENRIAQLMKEAPHAMIRQILPVKTKGNELVLSDLTTKLFELGFRSMFIEGGAITASRFLEQGFVDRLYVFQAPVLLGRGKRWSDGFRIDSLAGKLELLNPSLQVMGKDFMVTGNLATNLKIPTESKEVTGEYVGFSSDIRWMRSNNKVLFGVCGGLAKAFGWEPWIVRVILALSLLYFGTGLVIYLILALALPREDKLNEADDRKLLGVCVRIGQRTQFETGLVRAVFLALAFATAGLALLVYLALHFALPKRN